MLVLSRKKDQKVVLPGMGVTVQVMRCSENGVKLGFDAPPEIRILREELEYDPEVRRDFSLDKLIEECIEQAPSAERHAMRNKFNTLTIALQVIKDALEAGELVDAESTHQKLVQLLTQNLGTDNSDFPNQQPGSADSSAATVLVVEDQANEREMLAGILRMNGYQVSTAGDGVEALEYLEANAPPAFVLVDMQMPRCDGAAVIRQIRESARLSGSQVYVVSGCNEKETNVRASDVDAWHIKPVNPRLLLDSMSGISA